MQVLEAAAVAAHHDQVHALLVLDLEVADRPAAGASDAEAQLADATALELGGVERERQAVVGHSEAADGVRGGLAGVAALLGGARMPAGLHTVLAATVGTHGVTGERGRAEDQHEHTGETRELHRGASTRVGAAEGGGAHSKMPFKSLARYTQGVLGSSTLAHPRGYEV